MAMEFSDDSLIYQALKTTVLFFLALPLMPLLLFLAGLLWIYRICAIFIVWLFMPNLMSIVSLNDTSVARQAIKYSRKQAMVIPGVLVIDGHLDIDQVKDWFLTHVIFVRKNDGSLKYPKFRQVQKQFLGFLWWKWDPDFNIDYHIREYSASFGDARSHDISSVLTKCANLPLPAHKPAWDITIIRNYKGGFDYSNEKHIQTRIFCRISHSYCDGHSLLRMMTSHFKLESEISYVLNPHRPVNSISSESAGSEILTRSADDRGEGYTFVEKTIFFAYLCISFPHYLFCILRRNYDRKKISDNTSCSPDIRQITQQLFFTTTETFPAEQIESAVKRLGVSLQTLMVSAVALGYSLTKYSNVSSECDHIQISANIPWQTNSHEDPLCNNWAEAFYKINLKKCTSVKQIQNVIAFSSFSPLLAANYYFNLLFTIFPLWSLKNISTDEHSQINMSFVNGPPNKMAISDNSLNEFMMCTSVPRTDSDIGATVFSYNKSTQIILSANTFNTGFTSSEIKDLGHNINKSLKDLLKCCD